MDDPQRPIPPKHERIGVKGSDIRVGSFLYPGGLAAVHADGRSREEIWAALQRREVYGTSGPRILLWFSLLNGAAGPAPMGSEVELAQTPRFRVRAVGSFQQEPGCPEWSEQGLGAERRKHLCRDECYNPSDVRHRITAIEVVRIRPQIRRYEVVDHLIEDPWLTIPCRDDGNGCSATFIDPDYAASGRDALYYVRAIQEPTKAINGSPLETRFDEDGNAVAIESCWKAGCTDPAQERAWSSPIFVNQPLAPGEGTR